MAFDSEIMNDSRVGMQRGMAYAGVRHTSASKASWIGNFVGSAVVGGGGRLGLLEGGDGGGASLIRTAAIALGGIFGAGGGFDGGSGVLGGGGDGDGASIHG